MIGRFFKEVFDVLFRRELIGLRGEKPYLIRWVIYRRQNGAGLYIHLFIGDDPADGHDHPKRFTSIGLWGSYVEEVFTPDHHFVHFKAPWIRSFPAGHRHRIHLAEGFVWTLVKVGRETRRWGFYTPEGWVDHRDYRPGEDIRRDI